MIDDEDVTEIDLHGYDESTDYPDEGGEVEQEEDTLNQMDQDSKIRK